MSVAAAVHRRPGRSVQRRTRLAFAGGVLIAVTLFMAIGAINGQNNLLYALFGFSIGAVVCTGVIGGSSVMRLSIRREPISHAAVGEPVRLVYRVTNSSRFLPAFGVVVRETEPGVFVNAPVATAAVVPPGKTVKVRATGWCDRRGDRTLGSIEAVSAFPFSLTRKVLIFNEPARFLVTPAVVTLRPDVLRDVRVRSRSGSQTVSKPGHDGGFLGVREYQPGDPLRRIAWKASARTPHPVVRNLEDASMPRLRVVVDPGPAAQAPEAVASRERTAALALAVVRAAVEQGVSVRLLTGDDELKVRPGASGNSEAARRLAHGFSPAANRDDPADEGAVWIGRGRGPGGVGLDSDRLVDYIETDAPSPALPAPLTRDWHERRDAEAERKPAGPLARAVGALRRVEWR